MSDEGVGRPLGGSPSTEFFNLSAILASAPGLLITATAAAAAQTLHTGDAQATDVLYVQAFNNSANSATIYCQFGNTATTQSLPLALNASANGFLINGLPIGQSGVVSVWNSTASTGVVVFGSVQRTYSSG